MTDFHTHILPGIDDGAKNVDISLDMIKTELSHGISHIVFTPHFYPDRDLSEYFLKHRQQALELLINTAGEKGITLPGYTVGAEVKLTRGLSSYDYVKDLQIGNTGYILIELPYGEWINKWVLDEIYAIKARFNLNVILAHAERYIYNKIDFDVMKNIISEVSVVQINTESFMVREGRKWIKKFIKEDCAIVVGSDCHSANHRKPCMKEGLEEIEKKFGKDCANAFLNNAEVILDI